MGDHDCVPATKGRSDKIEEQVSLLEHRNAYQGDAGCIYWHHHTAQQSETRLEPTWTAKSKVGGKSEIPTIRPLWNIGGGTFWKTTPYHLFKGTFKWISTKSDFYRTAIHLNNKSLFLKWFGCWAHLSLLVKMLICIVEFFVNNRMLSIVNIIVITTLASLYNVWEFMEQFLRWNISKYLFLSITTPRYST